MKIDKMEFLIELNRKLKDYDWGIIYHNRKILNPSESDLWEKYSTITPTLFDSYKCGTCWDYVAYEDKVMLDKHIVHNSFYVESGSGESHSFIICTIDKKSYWFEASDKEVAGIYEFKTMNDALSYAIGTVSRNWNSKRITTYKYEPAVKALRAASCEKFMDYFHYQKPFNFTITDGEPTQIINSF